MIDFPKRLLPQYLKLLGARGVPAEKFAECIKWCRYFLDYCDKYPASVTQTEQVQLFVEKLKSKKQSDLACRQATYALTTFFEVQNQGVLPWQPDENTSHSSPAFLSLRSGGEVAV